MGRRRWWCEGEDRSLRFLPDGEFWNQKLAVSARWLKSGLHFKDTHKDYFEDDDICIEWDFGLSRTTYLVTLGLASGTCFDWTNSCWRLQFPCCTHAVRIISF